MDVFKTMGVPRHSKLVFFKLHMILALSQIFGLMGDWPKKGGLPLFFRQNVNKIDFPQFFHQFTVNHYHDIFFKFFSFV